MTIHVTYKLDFCYRETNYEAVMSRFQHFLPFQGMHIGPSQLLTVCQIHWLDDTSFLAYLEYPDFEPQKYYDKSPMIETPFKTLTDVIRAIESGCVDGPKLFTWQFFILSGDVKIPLTEEMLNEKNN